MLPAHSDKLPTHLTQRSTHVPYRSNLIDWLCQFGIDVHHWAFAQKAKPAQIICAIVAVLLPLSHVGRY